MRPLSEELQRLRQAGLYRRRRIVESPQGPVMRVDGREVLNFCSNDYLGLAGHPELVEAMRRGAGRWGAGSGAAHLINGHTAAHHALEEELADFVARPRALLFSTGYMANVGAITALAGRGDAVFQDRLNHASLLDGALQSGARLQRYAHADPAALAARLTASRAKGSAGERLVASDGVFSMDGDIAPLAALAAVARDHDALFMVDDAHGLGVVGAGGRGSLALYGLGVAEVPLLVGTLGKGFGSFGAFVAGPEELIEYLIQRARSYVFTTALPAAVAETTRAALVRVRADEWRRERLRDLVARFRAGAAQLGLALMDSPTPIQPLLVGDAEAASRLAEALWAEGVHVGAIRPPTVPEGSARLRITLTAAHDEGQVERLLAALDRSVER